MKPDILLKKIKNLIREKDPNAEIFLYGSRARGDARNDSDWDILILLDDPNTNFELEKTYLDKIYKIELESEQAISPLIYSKTEWYSKHYVTPLFKHINKEGIRI